MELKVMLGADKFISINDRFVVGDQTTVSFESEDYPLDELYVTVNDGVVARRYAVKNRSLDISEFCNKANVVEISVDLVLRGEIAKTWLLEPFVVKDVSGGYEFIPEIALLRQEIQTMKTIIKEMNSKIDDTM